ncbi:MAG: hypothetical protein Q9191_006326, partial [Dirinaria sp. TL-2023a]
KKLQSHAFPLKPKYTVLAKAQDRKHPEPTPRTSQALRQAAPLSKKKTRKMEKKIGFAKRRQMEAMGEVEMKDVNNLGKKGGRKLAEEPEAAEQKMDIDPAE